MKNQRKQYRTTTFSILPETWEQMDKIRRKAGITKTALIERLIAEAFRTGRIDEHLTFNLDD